MAWATSQSEAAGSIADEKSRVNTIQYTETIKMQTVHCASCGVPFAITEEMDKKLHETGGTFYCPNGHTLSFGSRLKELERKLAAKDAELSMACSRKAKHGSRTRRPHGSA